MFNVNFLARSFDKEEEEEGKFDNNYAQQRNKKFLLSEFGEKISG